MIKNGLKFAAAIFFFFSLLTYHLNVFLPTFPEVGCPKYLEFRNPWGKVMERSCLRCEPFLLKNGLKLLRREKKSRICFPLFTLFKRLFAPTTRNRMSKIFRDSESSGKSSGKKWSQIFTFLLIFGLQLPRQKKKLLLIFYFICTLLRYHLNVFSPPFPKVG